MRKKISSGLKTSYFLRINGAEEKFNKSEECCAMETCHSRHTTKETAKKKVSGILRLLRNRREINPVEFGWI
jgi:hypothetical protein